MGVKMTHTNYFRELSREARLLELQQDYIEAERAWRHLYEIARHSDNVTWAYARMLFCQRMRLREKP